MVVSAVCAPQCHPVGFIPPRDEGFCTPAQCSVIWQPQSWVGVCPAGGGSPEPTAPSAGANVEQQGCSPPLLPSSHPCPTTSSSCVRLPWSGSGHLPPGGAPICPTASTAPLPRVNLAISKGSHGGGTKVADSVPNRMPTLGQRPRGWHQPGL